MTSEKLKKAIDLMTVGNKQDALPMLKQAVREDREDVQAWLWLADCLSDEEQKKFCYQQVYRLNTHNMVARAALARMGALAVAPVGAPTPDELMETSQTVPLADPILDADKWEMEQVPVPFGFGGPKMDEVKRIVQEHVHQGWIYFGHDEEHLDTPEQLADLLFGSRVAVGSPLVNHSVRSLLTFGRNPTLSPRRLVNSPFAIRRWKRPGEQPRLGIIRHSNHCFKGIQGNMLAYGIYNTDRKTTGHKRVVYLYCDEACTEKVAECNDTGFYIYPASIETQFGTLETGDKAYPILKTLDGRTFSAMQHIGRTASLFSLPQGTLAFTRDGEVYRWESLSRLPEDDEWIILLWSLIVKESLGSWLFGGERPPRSYVEISMIDR